MKIYGLTFRGVTAYLASLSREAPPQIGEPGESVEAFKERYVKDGLETSLSIRLGLKKHALVH